MAFVEYTYETVTDSTAREMTNLSATATVCIYGRAKDNKQE